MIRVKFTKEDEGVQICYVIEDKQGKSEVSDVFIVFEEIL